MSNDYDNRPLDFPVSDGEENVFLHRKPCPLRNEMIHELAQLSELCYDFAVKNMRSTMQEGWRINSTHTIVSSAVPAPAVLPACRQNPSEKVLPPTLRTLAMELGSVASATRSGALESKGKYLVTIHEDFLHFQSFWLPFVRSFGPVSKV
ncbi:hypothetical protein BDZ97DRAFT_2062847 [Flammula alnicola]|nr:hypothetical protein BDZ97DRAFT_2062847 [Flammula alnicola]